MENVRIDKGSVEIYGLYDPDTNELRYVGKAKSSKERLKRHLCEARHESRPVHHWIRKLQANGKLPRVDVLETVPESGWKEAEIRLIAEHRKTSSLLNIADGGDRPSQTKEQRANAGRAASKARDANPAMARMWAAKRDMARMYSRFKKSGSWIHCYTLGFIMRCHAAENPDLYGDWANING